MTDFKEYQKGIIANQEKNKMKLHYDYQSYENILNNSIPNELDLLSSNEEKKELYIPSNPNTILNSNLKNYKFPKKTLNKSKNKSSNQIQKFTIYTQPQQTADNVNLNSTNNNINITNVNPFDNAELEFNFDEKIQKIENKFNKTNNEKAYLIKNRNLSFNNNKIKINGNIFDKDLKQKGKIYNKNLYDNFKENENEKIDKNEFQSECSKNNKDIIKDNRYFYNSFSKFPDYILLGKEETPRIESLNKTNGINNMIFEDYISNNINSNTGTKKKSHKSTPNLTKHLNTDLLFYSKNANNIIFETIKNKLLIENNKLKKEKKDIISKYKILKNKFESLLKDNFIIKTKFDKYKNNMNIMEKQLEEKNYDI